MREARNHQAITGISIGDDLLRRGCYGLVLRSRRKGDCGRCSMDVQLQNQEENEGPTAPESK
jgi:hypothetical protein